MSSLSSYQENDLKLSSKSNTTFFCTCLEIFFSSVFVHACCVHVCKKEQRFSFITLFALCVFYIKLDLAPPQPPDSGLLQGRTGKHRYKTTTGFLSLFPFIRFFLNTRHHQFTKFLQNFFDRQKHSVNIRITCKRKCECRHSCTHILSEN